MGRDAFDDFCSREWPRLVATLDLYCGDLQVAEELAQEALIRVYTRWRRVRNMESPGGFAHRVALNLANSHWRRRRAEGRAHERLYEPAATDHDVADAVAVRQAVLALPPQQRVTLVLRYWAGMSAHEAGDILDLTPGAVRALTHRAVDALRKSFITVPESTDD